MIWWTIIITLISYVLYKTYKNLSYWKYRNIKYVKPWPYIKSFTTGFLQRKTLIEQLNYLYYMYPEEKFIGTLQINSPVLMVRDPELIKLVTVKHFDNFINHTVIFTEGIDPLFDKNIVFLQGNKWRHMRATLSPAFTSSKMRTMYILIKECAEQFAEHLLEAEKDNGVITLEMKDLFAKYTNDIIATTAFGIQCNSLKNDKNEFYTMGKKFTSFRFGALIKMIVFMLMPKVMKFFKFRLMDKDVDNFFRNIIKDTIEFREKEGIIRPDMIHLLMEARKGKLKHETHQDEDTGFATVEESQIGKEENDDKLQLTNEDITAQAIIFFVAGYDTSSTLLCFLAYELATNPEIQQKLQEEIDETSQKCKNNIDYESLLKMKYLDMVICECLRMWPPAPMTERLSSNQYTLTDGENSVLLEKNQSVWMPVYCLHHDPKYFEDPEKFDPERFNDDNKKNIKPFTYLPFGAGPRNCIGSRFALLEIKALVVHLLAKFDLIVTEKTQVPLKLSKSQISMKSEKGVWLGLKARNKLNISV